MKVITKKDILEHRQRGSWRELEAVARKIVQDVEIQSGGDFEPVLGGGTRLMLALNHRISHDIDLFITTPQFIGYITPRLNDRVEKLTADYQEDADFIKLRFAMGEIDFIAQAPLLNLPTELTEESAFRLEPVAEVLAKKLFYRGDILAPRDLYDWWAIGTIKPELIPEEKIGKLLRGKQGGIENALKMLSQSTRAEIIWNEIQACQKPSIREATAWATKQLRVYSKLAEQQSNIKNSELKLF